MDLLSYFRVLRRRWWVIAICVVVGGGVGWASTAVDSGSATSGKSNTYYKATHTFLQHPNTGNAYPSSFTNLDQMALLATTGPVPDAVAKQLGGDESGQQLAEQITTLTNAVTSTLSITAVDTDAHRATQLAETFADQLSAQLTATDLGLFQQATKDANDQVSGVQAKMDALSAQIAATPPPANLATLQAQLRALQDQYSQAYGAAQDLASKQAPDNPLSTLQKAQPVPISADEYSTRLRAGELGQNNLVAGGQAAQAASAASSSSSLSGTKARVLLGLFLGLLVGIGLAMLLERLDRRIRTRADAEVAFALPVLAEVPVLSSRQQREHEVVAIAKPLSPAAEAYRSVRSSLLFQMASLQAGSNATADAQERLFNGEGLPPLVLMVTSAAPKDGKTTSSANLAAVFAEAGSSVLVLNCDFRRPMIHEYFGVSDEPRRVHKTSIPKVKVVSDVAAERDPNPAQVILMQRQLIAAARQQFDVVILDTAPLLSANDALEMVGEADLVLLVTRAGWSRAPAAQRAVEMLDRVDAPVVGTILVGAGEAESNYYAYYQPRGREPASRPAPEPPTTTNGNGHSEAERLMFADPGVEQRGAG
jgi:Mrp family chromosome partitioning ATPase/capsular polysaccharide biosynthesis protein